MKTLHLKVVPSNRNQEELRETRPAPLLLPPADKCEWRIRPDGSHWKGQARLAPMPFVPREWTIAPDGEFLEISRLVRS